MTQLPETPPHEAVRMARGRRSGSAIAVAVHSTVRGPALGGCRIRQYDSWSAGLADVLLLSEAMTYKAALAGLANGGGKTVVILPPGADAPVGTARADVLADVADVIAGLDGAYFTGPDIGTSPADMDVIGRSTPYVFCRTPEVGGSGDSGPATADGTIAAITAVAQHVHGTATLHGLRIGVLGLGSVGSRVARHLASAGAELLLADVDPRTRATLGDLPRARWTDVQSLPTAELDLLVPAAVGGLLTLELASRLRCAAVVGPANNQLADDSVADALHDLGIIWAPDYVVSAGGIISAVALEHDGVTPHEAAQRVRGIATTLTEVLNDAAQLGAAPHRAALAHARVLASSPPAAASRTRAPRP